MYLKRVSKVTKPEEFRLKFTTLVLSALLFATTAFCQEPVNHAVSQPVANQAYAQQPMVSESMLQLASMPPVVPYLSEPVIQAPRQAMAVEKVPPVIRAPQQPAAHQPGVCSCTVK